MIAACHFPLMLLSPSLFVSAQPDNLVEALSLAFFGKPQETADTPPIDPQPMLVVGAGMPRTGTQSLSAALDLLGYKSSHFQTLMDDDRHAAVWASVATGEASPQDAFQFLSHQGYNASVDYPTSDYVEEQLSLYPDAKVILTIRDSPQTWSRSFGVLRDLIRVVEEPFSWSFPNPIHLFFPAKYDQLHAVRCHFGVAMLGIDPCELVLSANSKNDTWLEEQYEAHVTKIKAMVPPEQLLVFQAQEGWEPLCHFLGVKEIPDQPYPHAGESRIFRRITIAVRIVSYGWAPILLIVVIWVTRRMLKSVVGKKKNQQKPKRS